MIDDVTSDRSLTPPYAPAEDFDRPGSARVYDYLLGGASHGAVDRALARDLVAAQPRLVTLVRQNRAFVRRAVEYLVDAGVEQFLDLGSGIPTMGSVHEIARRRAPGARVVHVDVDPIAAAHAEHLLSRVDGVTAVRADLRDPDAVLAAPGVAELIDLARPVGLLMFSVLQHVPDADDPGGVIARYLSRLAPGSALALSHLSVDDPRLDLRLVLDAVSRAYPGGALTMRSREGVAALMAGVELVSPGIVWASDWRPEPREQRTGDEPEPPVHGHHAGVGFLPAH